MLQFSPNSIAFIAVVIFVFFLVFLAHTIIICDLSMVISVLEDVSGSQALLRSSVLIRGQTRIGLITFIGSTIGMVFVKGLFEHRVKSLSYRDGSSKFWEEPVMVLMYSFVVLIDFMMSTVFYISCRSYNLEASTVECKPALETMSVSIASLDNCVATDSSCPKGKILSGKISQLILFMS
ncbi:hypothetical protein L2E82_13654 [Cichorium intybus]|uniref:Uncharacterized protein n=1 Tax=Cichorium intybus TaxID=13427 RepID=A0ACB9EY89_CICIN|nr:hypothetical protein L2E82_13654 [Cichorium intybus]